ncbi:hypothetical protein [Cohnella nanjingensis]|uniref:DUF5348 domain-containing protein n=1 Tax=Cohnella nanjingensis TaxID=1387779 RepID=A0A7X0RW58_9BACL|nr:hypothetical protein [Cohnella nanjingensis]MBB6674792.1 hypothetical protein [Cohnella nanjingensis]
MKRQKTVIEGRVAYDVENDEWVMYIEDGFVYMGDLYAAVNRRLAAAGEPPLVAGDELEVKLRRAGTG